MNKRERILLMVVAGVGALIALYFIGYNWLGGKFTALKAEISKLEMEVNAQKTVLNRGPQIDKRMAAYKVRALSPQTNQAKSAYLEFLVDTAKRKAELRDVNADPRGSNPKKGIYTKHTFSLIAEGNLEKLTRFLYLFYSVDYLHRVQMMRLTPIERSKDLRLTLTIEALSLPDAPPRTQLKSGPAERLALASEDDYLKVILDRNLFGPPNQAPKIASIGTQQATTKKPFSLDIKVTENDWLDILKCELDSPSAKDATLKPIEPAKPTDPPAMKFSWTPPAKGEYSFTVRVLDDGLPQREDKKAFKIVVKDPPPPPAPIADKPKPPKFDVAKFTYLTSILVRDGEPGIWLIERTTGKRWELAEGDKFEVGSVKGTVTKIGSQEVEIEVDGKRRVLPLGASLVEAAPEL